MTRLPMFALSCVPRLAAALAMTMALSACQVGGVEGDAVLGVEVREVAPFHEVVVTSVLAANVRLQSSGAPRVEVRGDRNLLAFVSTRVVDERLYLTIDGAGVSPRLPLEVHLSVAGLRRVEVNGGASVDLKGAFGDELRLYARDAGELSASGDVRHLVVEASGGATLRAGGLVAERVELRASGASAAEVCATRELEVSVSGTSLATYCCHPTSVKTEVTADAALHER